MIQSVYRRNNALCFRLVDGRLLTYRTSDKLKGYDDTDKLVSVLTSLLNKSGVNTKIPGFIMVLQFRKTNQQMMDIFSKVQAAISLLDIPLESTSIGMTQL